MLEVIFGGHWVQIFHSNRQFFWLFQIRGKIIKVSVIKNVWRSSFDLQNDSFKFKSIQWSPWTYHIKHIRLSSCQSGKFEIKFNLWCYFDSRKHKTNVLYSIICEYATKNDFQFDKVRVDLEIILTLIRSSPKESRLECVYPKTVKSNVFNCEYILLFDLWLIYFFLWIYFILSRKISSRYFYLKLYGYRKHLHNYHAGYINSKEI